MKRLCTICARGGSKGVLNKNLRLINDKPLIYYTLKQALESGIFDVVAVSSDSEDILQIAKKFGAQIVIKRPEELATDTAAKLPVIVHAAKQAEELSSLQFDTFVDLDCTSPLRNIDDILGAVELLESGGISNVITGTPARRSPYFNLVEDKGDGYVGISKTSATPITRRQDAPNCYDMNASIYVWTRKTLFNEQKLFLDNTKIYVMPEERSLDIDSEFDFLIVSFLLGRR
jgi:N-acylneuraminate cytidylyltransferase/CMP-N,N'-diacetyllegionaminic acid synthase